MAALIVERLSGERFEDFVSVRLFQPIGMTTATYFFPDTTSVETATLYGQDGQTPYPYWHVFIRPAGAINASADDMGHYVRFLLNRGMVDGHEVVPRDAIERMERSETSLDALAGLAVGYGLHMSRYVDSLGFVWTGHDGGVQGGLTNMAYLPSLGVGYAFMINSGSSEAERAISRLFRDFVTRGAPRPEVSERVPMPAIAEWEGWYRPDNPRVQHLYFLERIIGLTRVRGQDTGLVLQPVLNDPIFYVPVGDHTFRGGREPVPTLALVNDSANGRPVAIEAMGYLLPTSLVRIPAWRAWSDLIVTIAWLLGLGLASVAAVTGALKWVVRRARGRDRAPSPVRRIWRFVIMDVAMLGLAFVVIFLMVRGGSSIELGNRTVPSLTMWLSLWLYLILAAAAVIVAWRRIATDAVQGWFARTSMVVVRSIAVLNVLAAAYLLRWGFIGWRPWA